MTYQLVYAKEELASTKNYNTTLMEMYNDLKVRWNAIWQEPEMTEAWKRVEARKEQEAKEKATLIQRQISCNIQNDKKLRVNANIYSI